VHGGNGGNPELDRESRLAQWHTGNTVKARLNRRKTEPAYASYAAYGKAGSKMDKDMGPAFPVATGIHSRETRRRAPPYLPRKTAIRNEVTRGAPLHEGAARQAHGPPGRIRQEANALGKAKGYADMATEE
jgi:hypothetical protein